MKIIWPKLLLLPNARPIPEAGLADPLMSWHLGWPDLSLAF